CQQHNTHPLTF
nr:immunoglobulin light chain junction region [Macaca mulatta]